MPALSDDEILSICEAEIEAASGYTHGELAEQRADALDRYLGEDYGDEVEGRSSVHSRDVMETVEWILPSLVRIFCDQENLVMFAPTGPEDEEQAEQETDVCNHVYWKQNRGFYNTYTFLKDCLLSKTGILKVWWEEYGDEEREEYTGLDDMQLGELLMDRDYEREVIEYELEEDGHHVVFKAKRLGGKICIDPVPPEEFGVEREARSPYAKDCAFSFHRTKKTFSELVQEGYDPDILETLPSDDDVDTEERLARRHLDDEQEGIDYNNHRSMRTFWITECYVRLDRNGDDIAELLKVTMAAGAVSGSGARLLDVEEVDRVPFATATPNILTHKFYGLSIADLIQDVQEIKTTLVRNILDNVYIANNNRTAANSEYVNVDDLLTSRPGAVVRVKGELPIGQVLSPIPHNPLPTEVFGVLEYLDEMKKQRVGAGDDVAGLDKSSLAQVNTGVFALAYDAARMKIELIARIIAEIGFKPLFKDIHELLQKNQDREMMVKLRGKWVPVKPSDWKSRENTTALIGVGQVSRERKIMALEAVMAKQAEAAASGGMGTLLTPQHMYQTYKDWTSAWGLEDRMYWMDPREAPPPPEGPSVEEQMMMAQMQALQMDAQAKMDKNQVDMQKAQMEAQLKAREFELREREAAAKFELEQLKSQQAAIKSSVDTQGKVADMAMQHQKQAIDSRVKELEQNLQLINAERDREIDVYKIQMDAVTKMLQLTGNTQPTPEEQAASEEREMVEAQEKQGHQEMMAYLVQSVSGLTEKLGQMDEERRKPKKIVRDKNGLIVQIGDQVVERDESGAIASIG